MTIPQPIDGPPTHYHEQYACDKNHDPDPGPIDPVRLAIERDQSWELMRYFERQRDEAERQRQYEIKIRKQHEIKSRAFDQLRTLMQNGKLKNEEAAAIVKSAFDRWKQFIEASNKKAA